jgi:hypothetical protein
MPCVEGQIPGDTSDGGGSPGGGGGGGGGTDPGDGSGGGSGGDDRPPARQQVSIQTRGTLTSPQSVQLNYTVYNDSNIYAIDVDVELSDTITGGSRVTSTTVPANGNVMLNSRFVFGNQAPEDATLCAEVKRASYS